MWIHLFRHGIAFDREDPRCPPDPLRPLTDKGIRRTRAAAAGLRRIGVEPDLVLTSPLLRARQTADIVRDVAAGGVSLKQSSAFVPEGDPSDMLDVLVQRGAKAPLCVGHSPSLNELAAYLVGSDAAVVTLKKAGLATLAVRALEPGGCTLYAVLPPATLRALGDE
ncbi:MAG: phosphohistidine phosphatase SixA [Myxococcota bacterium]